MPTKRLERRAVVEAARVQAITGPSVEEGGQPSASPEADPMSRCGACGSAGETPRSSATEPEPVSVSDAGQPSEGAGECDTLEHPAVSAAEVKRISIYPSKSAVDYIDVRLFDARHRTAIRDRTGVFRALAEAVMLSEFDPASATDEADLVRKLVAKLRSGGT
jgi:hypothetical protein